MKLRHLFLALALCFTFVYAAQAVDKTVEWDPVDGAAGYRISTSIDAGATWQPAELNGVVVGDIPAGTMQIVATMSDTGLTLIRAASYNNIGEAIGTTSGVWFNPLWQISAAPTELRTPGE